MSALTAPGAAEGRRCGVRGVRRRGSSRSCGVLSSTRSTAGIMRSTTRAGCTAAIAPSMTPRCACCVFSKRLVSVKCATLPSAASKSASPSWEKKTSSVQWKKYSDVRVSESVLPPSASAPPSVAALSGVFWLAMKVKVWSRKRCVQSAKASVTSRATAWRAGSTPGGTGASGGIGTRGRPERSAVRKRSVAQVLCGSLASIPVSVSSIRSAMCFAPASKFPARISGNITAASASSAAEVWCTSVSVVSAWYTRSSSGWSASSGARKLRCLSAVQDCSVTDPLLEKSPWSATGSSSCANARTSASPSRTSAYAPIGRRRSRRTRSAKYSQSDATSCERRRVQ